jgi:hypothetical protein
MKKNLFSILFIVLFCGLLVLFGTHFLNSSIPDDAKEAGKTVADFPETGSHAFDSMDGGINLSDKERKGRNTWLLWTAGDQVFWDHMAQHGLGTADLLKTIDSRHRNSRFKDMGLVNEPGYQAAARPDEYGLWLDVGPIEAGVDPAVYGRPSGIVGLRIYPNPHFDSGARQRWDAARYFSDPRYYNDPTLVRPYTIGMSCSFCHVSFNPISPPVDPENPKWENLSSTIGNQYINASKVFAPAAADDSYVYQLFHSWAAGTIDTSFIATDNLNNPSNINAIFALPPRMAIAQPEKISGGAMRLPGEQATMSVPHVLKDGADSVGIVGALSRVYVSIGEYSQEWLRDQNPLVGGLPQRPFEIAKAQAGSVYWQATATRIPNLAGFLLKMTGPRLADAPAGPTFLTTDAALLHRGKIVFAENCAVCHSSKQPPATVDRSSQQYLEWMRSEVLKPDFLEDNYLSTDERIPVTIIQTNAARALATNATAGHVWDNFSSETYKNSSSVGSIETFNPFDNSSATFKVPGGGPGYYRVPSLVGIWATAPFFHNNSLGEYTGDPSVQGRIAAFKDAMEKLLWPQKRRGTDSIARTTVESYIEIPTSYLPKMPYLPKELQPVIEKDALRIGPIPAGTPIDLLANADLDLSDRDKTIERIKLVDRVQHDLRTIREQNLTAAEAQKLMMNLVPALLSISKCPDFIEDRGHTFGANLTDEDKRALIEFLKTF